MKHKKQSLFLFLFPLFSLILACQNKKILTDSPDNYPIDTTIKAFNSLPSQINESSGLLYFGDAVWTHNDSGDGPCLYQLKTENSDWEKTLIQREIFLENAQSQDWEELAQDEDFIYVGDFGNNGGQRQDLVIYKISKTELSNDTISNFERILFQYPDQDRFDYNAYEHNFDCEAMIVLEDSIYLFSKNHQDYKTRLYSLPKIAGNHSPILLDSFDTKGTITAAGIDKTNKILVLTGYKFNGENRSFNPFLWTFWEYSDNQFFKGKNQRINFPMDKQVEGVCLFEEGQFLLSSEGGFGKMGELYLFNPKKWVK